MAADRPYIFVYDVADTVADGSVLTKANVQVDPDSVSFHMRRLTGHGTVTNRAAVGRFTLYDRGGYAINTERGVTPYATQAERFIEPELVYGRNDQIAFNVSNVAKLARAYPVGGSVPNYYSQVCFQGVKRYDTAPYKSPYHWEPLDYDVAVAIPITWAGRVAPAYVQPEEPRSFYVLPDNFDWHWYGVSMAVQKALDTSPVEPYLNFKFRFYDAGRTPLMSSFVTDWQLNTQSTYAASIWPAAPVVYPVGSQMRIDILSGLINTEVPATLHLTLHGQYRVPCGQGSGQFTGGL